MAKTSSVEKNNRRIKMAKQYAGKRATLKAMAVDHTLPPEERFDARLKLAELPRNCVADARPPALRADRAVRAAMYRKFKLSRIALRELASPGRSPGMVKSSW